jgi:hypothetical protein
MPFVFAGFYEKIECLDILECLMLELVRSFGMEDIIEDCLDLFLFFMVTKLIEKGEITNITKEDAVVTYIAGILRSVRFGAASSHGKANMMCYNFMEQNGAFTRNAEGLYVINIAKSIEAMNKWADLIIKTQGDGNYDFAVKFRKENGTIKPALQKDLDKINQAGIPRDIRFNQGVKQLGL